MVGKINELGLLSVAPARRIVQVLCAFRSMAAFSLNLQRRVESTLIVSGKFDGSHACLAAATSAGNVLIHSPHRESSESLEQEKCAGRLSWSGELAELQIGKQVCLTKIYFK